MLKTSKELHKKYAKKSVENKCSEVSDRAVRRKTDTLQKDMYRKKDCLELIKFRDNIERFRADTSWLLQEMFANVL